MEHTTHPINMLNQMFNERVPKSPNPAAANPIYIKDYESHIDGTDESSLSVLRYTRAYSDNINNGTIFEDEADNLDKQFCNGILQEIISEIRHNSDIQTEAGDFIEAKVTDQNIYITIFFSGQY